MAIQLIKTFLVGVGVSTLLLAGCAEGDTETESQEQEQTSETNETASNGSMSFDLESLREVKEAENLPAEDKEAILADFNQYIEAFNEEDVEKYMEVISDNPVNFKYDEEKEYVQRIFESVDSKRTTENVTIINYRSEKADVYAEMTGVTKDPESGKEITQSGKQVTIMHKEEDRWKVSAVFFIMDEPENEEE